MMFQEEKGAISLSDFFLAGISALVVGALAVPFMLGQQAEMHNKVAQIDARTIATEVELFLQSNRNIKIDGPAPITHNSTTQILNIEVPGLDPSRKSMKLQLSEGSRLALPTGSDSTASSNLLRGPNDYCITVDVFGQLAHHNQNGPTSGCN
jgi:hypothetical protein